MSTNASWQQAAHLLTLVANKGTPLEQIQRLYSSGLLADLFDANIDQVNRDDFRRLLGLSLLQTKPAAEAARVIVHVDRSIRPMYPSFADQSYVNELEFVRLEATGPAEYRLDSLQLSLHPKQEQGHVANGQEVWVHQKELGLEGCLGLSDLLAIQKLGIATFCQHFGGKAVFAGKSVVRDDGGDLRVPYLVERDGRVVLRWHWLGLGWGADDPAPRFA